MDLDDTKMHEYDAQLYGFTVEDFMTAIKSQVRHEVTCLIETMTNTLVKKYSSDETEIEKVKEITKSLIDQYINASTEPLKALNVQLKDLMHIPPHVLLPADSAQRKQYCAEDEQEVDSQIKELLHRIKRTQAFDVELKQELKMLRDALPVLNERVAEFSRLATEHEAGNEIFQQLGSSIDETLKQEMQLLNINKDL